MTAESSSPGALQTSQSDLRKAIGLIADYQDGLADLLIRVEAAKQLLDLMDRLNQNNLRRLIQLRAVTPTTVSQWIEVNEPRLQSWVLRRLGELWQAAFTGTEGRSFLTVSQCLDRLHEYTQLAEADAAKYFGYKLNAKAVQRLKHNLRQLQIKYGDVTPQQLEQLGGIVRDTEPHLLPMPARHYYQG